MKRGIFFSWLVSYVLILFIPIVFYISNYLLTRGIVESEISRANSAMLKQVQLNIDNVFKDAQKLSMDIILNPRTDAIMSYKDGVGKGNIHYTAIQLYNDFKRYNVTNGYIGDFYVFSKSMDLVVSTVGSAESRLMYGVLGNKEVMNYEQWYDLHTSRQIGKFIALSLDEKGTQSLKDIIYIQSFPMNPTLETLGTIAISLNKSRLQEVIDSVQGDHQSEIYIIDNEDKLLWSAGEKQHPSYLIYNELKEGTGIIRKKIDGEKLIISYVKSDISQLKYVSVIPESVYWQKSKYLQKLAYISIILAIFIGVIASYFSSNKNYNPIREILSTISLNKVNNPKGNTHNEYHYIKEVILNTLDEKEKLSKKLEQQYSIFKANFLLKLLKGDIGDKIPIEDALTSMDIEFTSNAFAVILVYIEDLGKISHEGEKPGHEDNVQMARFVIGNVFEEIASHKHKGYVTEVDGMQACLINLNAHSAENKRELISIVEEAQKFVQEYFQIVLTASISDIHETLQGIPKAYDEAYEAMEYKLIMGSGKVICFEDITESPKQNYYYPLETEQRLINCIKSGEYEKVETILENVFNNNFSDSSTLSIHMGKCLMFDMISTVIKATNEVGGVYTKIFETERNPVERLFKCETITEMKKIMLSILKKVCVNVQAEKNSATPKFCDMAIDFIKNNFHDPNLGLAMVAEHFDMTPPYVSKLFKDQTGEGMLDFINKVKVAEAKRLLSQEKLGISETAVRVGYLNSNALIRSFKKCEGITPGQYKEMV